MNRRLPAQPWLVRAGILPWYARSGATYPTLLIQDIFRDADSTNLTAHALDSGGAWTTPIGTWDITTKRARSATVVSGRGFALTETSASDAVIYCDVSTSATAERGVLFRAVDENNLYMARYAFVSPGRIELWRRVAGTFTMLASQDVTLPAGGTSGSLPAFTLVVRLDGNDITVEAPTLGATITASSSTFATATKHGLYTNATGATFDNFTVYTPHTGFNLVKPPNVPAAGASEAIDATITATIDAANPTTASDPHPVGLIGGANQKRLLAKFDVSGLAGKTIRSARLALNTHDVVNGTVNDYFDFSVYRMLRAWTSGVTWNTYDGSNAWGAAGALDATDSALVVSDDFYRPVLLHPTINFDVTDLVAGWADGSIDNHGLVIVSENTVSIPVNVTDYGGLAQSRIQLHVRHDDGSDTIEDSALSRLAVAGAFGSWREYHGFSRNALANAHQAGLGADYLARLTEWADYYIDAAGALQNGAVATRGYDTAHGPALIYLHQQTSAAKYKTALDTLRDLMLGNAVDGTYGVATIDGNVYAELGYNGIAFMGVYGDTYAHTASTDWAIDQALKLYDALAQAGDPPAQWASASIANRTSSIGWGRGMGWLMGIAKLLPLASIQAHADYAGLLSRYQAFAAELLSHQHSSGMWRSRVQDETMPLETTGTASIALGLEYGYQAGVLDSTYAVAVDRARSALGRFSETGYELGQAFTDNRDLTYQQREAEFERIAKSWSAWMELVTKVLLRA